MERNKLQKNLFLGKTLRFFFLADKSERFMSLHLASLLVAEVPSKWLSNPVYIAQLASKFFNSALNLAQTNLPH
jgi:hypothetical protein